MKPRNLALWLSLVVVVATPAAIASEKDLALAAEQAGNLREAVVHYASAFRALSWSDAGKSDLEAKIVALAAKLDPPPAIPEAAQRRGARGRAALKAANSSADFDDAANEFLAAINEAPWWPEAHFNLGVVREKQRAYPSAIASFKAYLALAPQASDAPSVKDKIYELEYLLEKQTKAQAQAAEANRRQQEEAAAAARREQERRAAMLRNLEALSGIRGTPSMHWQVTISGNRIVISYHESYNHRSQQWGSAHPCPEHWEGTIDGVNLNLTMSFPKCGGSWSRPPGGSYPVTGVIDPEKETIMITADRFWNAGDGRWESGANRGYPLEKIR
jgi:tetratricopeptide (TPR) repeat protein